MVYIDLGYVMRSDNPSPILVRDLTFGTLLRPHRLLIPRETNVSPTTVDIAMVGAEYKLERQVESLDDATTPNRSNGKV